MNIANDNAPSLRESLFTPNAPADKTTQLTKNASSPQSSPKSPQQTPNEYVPVWQAQKEAAKSLYEYCANLASPALTTIWITSLAANIWAIMSPPINSLHLTIVLLAMWSSLGVTYVAQKDGRRALAEVAALAALSTFGLAIYITSLRFGLFASSLTTIALSASAAIALALATLSKLCLRASLALSIIWVATALTAPMLSPILLSFPAILAIQIFAAMQLRDSLAVWLCAAAGYGGLCGLCIVSIQAQFMTAAMACSTMFIAAVLHYRNGKRLQDLKGFAALTHSYWGWTLMMASLLCLQYFAVNPLEPFAPSWTHKWSTALALGTVGIFVTELLRSNTRPQNPALAILITASSAALVLCAANQAGLVQAMAPFNPQAFPILTLSLAGVTTAIALAALTNGIRRHLWPVTILGLCALCVQVIISGKLIAYSLETIAIFVGVLFISSLGMLVFAQTQDDM